MCFLNQVTIDHIENLKDLELSQLLHLLLHSEAQKERLKEWDASVPFNITTGDAGSDGKMVWTGKPIRTPYVPNKFTIFQNKATELNPSKCFEEILETEKKGKSRKLKAQLKKLVEANGCYILFTTQAIVDNGKEERIKEFRRAITECGHTNASTFEIYVYDANKIKDWVNEYIEAVLFVQQCNGITRPTGFITWPELGLELNEAETPFQSNATTDSNITTIRTAIENEKAIRISGHSGLGKTRLVFETFGPRSVQPAVTSGLVYYDVGLTSNSAEISKYIISHRNKQHGTIVIDNCDAQTHQELSKLVRSQGNIKIITLGFDDSRSIEDPKIRLDRNNQRDLVSSIVEQKLGSHDTSDKEYIKNLSEGYPWMAVKFCTGVLRSGMSNLGQYSLDEFIQKLLFNAKEGKEEHAVICACSVFSAFGFLDDSLLGLISPDVARTLQAQMDFIRTEIYDGSLSDSRFKEICNKFRTEDIIEKRGTLYIVKPTVLAIHLASHWLIINSPAKIRKVIETLKNAGLEEKFIDRLTDLDQLDKAKDLVGELWGTQGFFGSAEVLSTNWGSLLFRYVVEVNPIATVDSLNKVFSGKSIAEIRELTEPRRNLVWALEKLVFRTASFEKASKILYRFAVAENETWANNATSQFVHLFQLFLPGTEVNFTERLPIIKWGLQQNENEFTRIAVLALGRGLLYDHFSRGGGAENQGSSAPLKDYTPSNWQEIFDYWSAILELLIPIASVAGPNSTLARDAIVKAIRSLAKYGKINLVNDAIRAINSGSNSFWPEALEALKRTLDFEKQLLDEHQKLITELITLLTPKDLKTQLYLTVSKPVWSYSDPNDFRGEKQIQKANDLAEAVIKDNLPIEDFLEELLKGEQRQGFTFGHKLGRLSHDQDTLVKRMLTILADIPKNEQNPEVLVGFVIGTKDTNLIHATYHSIIANEKIAHQAFYFARIAKLDIDEIEKLFEVVDNFGLPISHFSSFQYGRGGDAFSVEEIIRICTKLKNYGMAGRWTSLSILFMYCFTNDERFQQCKEFLKELVSEANMGLTDENLHTMEAFHWSETITKLLTDIRDVSFAKTVMGQIVEIYSDYNFRNQLDHHAPKVLQVLFNNYFEETWSILGEGIIGNNYVLLLNIRSAIGAKNGWMGGNGILFENSERNQLLFEWCKLHPNIAPKRVANMMPLEARIGNRLTWHPFSRQIIDTFGNQEAVLDELSANMGTYGSIGSRVDYLEMLRDSSHN